MKAKFSLKFKIFDIFVLAFAALFIVGSIIGTNIYVNAQSSENLTVQIYYQGQLLEDKQVKMGDVEDTKEIVLTKEEYPSLLGDMTIEISKDKGVCVKEVTCPNQTCKKQGYVKNIGYPIVCIPNGVYVIITSDKVDNDIILG